MRAFLQGALLAAIAVCLFMAFYSASIDQPECARDHSDGSVRWVSGYCVGYEDALVSIVGMDRARILPSHIGDGGAATFELMASRDGVTFGSPEEIAARIEWGDAP